MGNIARNDLEHVKEGREVVEKKSPDERPREMGFFEWVDLHFTTRERPKLTR